MPAEEDWATFFDTEGVLDALDCDGRCGDVVEFGCGYGLFTAAAARRVSGVVHALDIEPAMVEATARRAAAADLPNVRAVCRDFMTGGSGLPGRTADYAMLFNILHIEDPVSLLTEALRSLVAGGRAGIIHWNYDPATPRGPSMAIRPTPAECQAWAEAAGFEFVRFEPLGCCPYHYGLLVRRPFG